MNQQDKIRHLLEKLRQGNCSEEELLELKKRMREDEGKSFEQFLDTDLEKQSSQINKNISKALWQSITKSVEAETSANRKYGIGKRLLFLIIVAAFIAGLFFLSYSFFHSQGGEPKEIIVAENKGSLDPLLIVLPDSSKVWLNANSRLSYPNTFSANQRIVRMEGQAFFDVVHNSEKPFTVLTSDLTVRVLGTSFDIEAYEKSEGMAVALFSGSVAVNSKKQQKNWTLYPNQQLTYSKEGQAAVKNFNPDFRAIWRTGEIKFEETNMAEVLIVLQQQYPNISIELSNDQLLKAKLSATFNASDPVEDILELICFSKGWDLEKFTANQFRIQG